MLRGGIGIQAHGRTLMPSSYIKKDEGVGSPMMHRQHFAAAKPVVRVSGYFDARFPGAVWPEAVGWWG